MTRRADGRTAAARPAPPTRPARGPVRPAVCVEMIRRSAAPTHDNDLGRLRALCRCVTHLAIVFAPFMMCVIYPSTLLALEGGRGAPRVGIWRGGQ